MKELYNLIAGQREAVGQRVPEEKFVVRNPASGDVVCEFSSTPVADIDRAVAAARDAFVKWSKGTHKQRSQILFKFRHLCLENYKEELVTLIMTENGKHRTDATASLLKGIETCEYALSMSLGSGSIQEVSSGISCQDRRDPVGVIVSICPFNFPAMVPMWTVPILVALGNTVIVKPSEKVPFTITRMVEIMTEAGLPDGVVSVVHGGKSVVSHLITHNGVDGVTFVGSTPVAEIVYNTAVRAGKRAICLGGAKNHLVVLPDADPEQSSTDILNSFAGSAGQRCMAASVLVLVASDQQATASVNTVLERVIEKAKSVKPGQTGAGEIGPVIDQTAIERISKYITSSETKFGATVHADGRSWTAGRKGFWIGPTVLEHPQEAVDTDPALKDEIFGPVLSVIRVNSLQDAIDRINASQFGNAACIYTRSGPAADRFTRSVHPGMIGVNIGVPVPREPFSFGGTKRSKFGIGDITGDGLVEFGTVRRKVTTKWFAVSATDFVAKNFTG
jgi:methylmalonic acid semialdehyde dehydrogenase